jgi:mannosyl-3-phosphoglycerate phosphatase
MNLVVFTDLDGCLLDHWSYSYEAAQPALELIRRRQIPLVFTTSKTRVEVERLQRSMQLKEPFIVENGAAVFFPDGYRGWRIDAGFRQHPYTLIQLGATYGEIRRFIYSVRDRFPIKGFGDLSVAEVAKLTGLPHDQAALAKKREFTEPFIVEHEFQMDALQRIAEAKGFYITRGGRFFHLIGIRQDKGSAAAIVANIFSKNAKGPIVRIGLGDSANDISLLNVVDIPILIPHPDGRYETFSLPSLRRASKPGSEGWNEMLRQILDHPEHEMAAHIPH